MTVWHSVLLEQSILPPIEDRRATDLEYRAKRGYEFTNGWGGTPTWDDLPPHRKESWREAVRNGRVP